MERIDDHLHIFAQKDTHMRHHHLSNHHHQIVHTNSRPLSPSTPHACGALSNLAQLNSDFPRSLQEQPQEIALL